MPFMDFLKIIILQRYPQASSASQRGPSRQKKKKAQFSGLMAEESTKKTEEEPGPD